MSNQNDHPAAPFEVENPAAAFRKLEDFARKVLAVPKKRVDAKLAADKGKKRSEVSRRKRPEGSA